jgi:hypothetical protein
MDNPIPCDRLFGGWRRRWRVVLTENNAWYSEHGAHHHCYLDFHNDYFCFICLQLDAYA